MGVSEYEQLEGGVIPVPRILLIQRAGYPDADPTATPAKQGHPRQWEIPGGRVQLVPNPNEEEPDKERVETDEECLVRCVRAETGFKVRSLGAVSAELTAPPGVVTAQSDDALVHICEVIGGELTDFPTSSHLDARWVSVADLFSGEIQVLTNPTSKGYVSRMMTMILAGFRAHQSFADCKCGKKYDPTRVDYDPWYSRRSVNAPKQLATMCRDCESEQDMVNDPEAR